MELMVLKLALCHLPQVLSMQAGNMTKPSFFTVVQNGSNPSNFREATVSAAYTDLRQKDTRKNTINMSGLPSQQYNDKL